MPVAPKNRDTLPQPTRPVHKAKAKANWGDTSDAYVTGKAGKESDSYTYDDKNDKRKDVDIEQIKKQGLYEVPEKFDDDDGDNDHQSEEIQNEKNVDKEELSKQALKKHLYEIPEDDQKEEELDRKVKEEGGRRRDGRKSNGGLSSLGDEETENGQETAEEYQDSEVLDYAKKFKGRGRVVLDFSKGKENAKIIVYKYGTGKGALNSIEERTSSRLDRRRSSVEQKAFSQNLTEDSNKKTVIRMFYMCYSCT